MITFVADVDKFSSSIDRLFYCLKHNPLTLNKLVNSKIALAKLH